MTHDPLCPFVAFVRYAGPCQCDLIAKVRADERNRVFTHLDALGPHQLGNLVGASVQFGIGNRLSAGPHDDGGLIGIRLGVN